MAKHDPLLLQRPTEYRHGALDQRGAASSTPMNSSILARHGTLHEKSTQINSASYFVIFVAYCSG